MKLIRAYLARQDSGVKSRLCSLSSSGRSSLFAALIFLLILTLPRSIIDYSITARKTRAS